MLPGFRFLFAAIVLSLSVLVFGLGAAALLRAAHEQVASIPARPAPPETVFVQQADVTNPTLALLRVDTPDNDNATDHVVAAATSTSTAAPAAESDGAAAPPAAPPLSEAVKPENQVSEISPQSDTASAQSEKPAAADIQIASSETAPAPTEPASPSASATTDSTRIAALGDQPVTSEKTAVEKTAAEKTAKAADPKPKSSVASKRARVKRVRERRKLARRTRPAPQAAQQLAPDPFSQQQFSQQQTTATAPTPAVRSH